MRSFPHGRGGGPLSSKSPSRLAVVFPTGVGVDRMGSCLYI